MRSRRMHGAVHANTPCCRPIRVPSSPPEGYHHCACPGKGLPKWIKEILKAPALCGLDQIQSWLGGIHLDLDRPCFITSSRASRVQSLRWGHVIARLWLMAASHAASPRHLNRSRIPRHSVSLPLSLAALLAGTHVTLLFTAGLATSHSATPSRSLPATGSSNAKSYNCQ